MKIFESLDICENFPILFSQSATMTAFISAIKKLSARVVQKARETSGTAMLMTFNPHPLSVLKPDTYTRLITPLHLKKKLIEEMRY